MPAIRILPMGEQAMVVEFGSSIDPQINARVHRLATMLIAELRGRIVEVVPTYRSLTVFFDPLVIARRQLQEEIVRLLASVDDHQPGVPPLQDATELRESAKLISIPVSYGGEFGPDLDFVAAHNAITPEQLIALHTSKPYRVYMLGFMPGFAYLGGMPEQIAAPRLDVPRLKVAAGSVGIAGNQTGVYPMESPGGWRIVGRTPLQLFAPSAERPFLLAAGDSVQFAAITAEEFRSVAEQVERRSYSPSVSTVGSQHVHGR